MNRAGRTSAAGKPVLAVAWLRRVLVSVLRRCAANRHFLIAVVVLGGSWLGWRIAVEALKVVTDKEAVAWPVGVRVDQSDFRILSLPTVLGPFRLAEDGELYKNKDGTPKLDGIPDGETVIVENVMELLKIGTSRDAKMVSRRKSNWYLSRRYVDTRKKRGEAFWLWSLDMAYYTGGLDMVPHVPERCLIAAGMTLLGGDDVRLHVPRAPEPWNVPITFRRIRYEVPRLSRRGAQYYVFSLNGYPEAKWTAVRSKLSRPWGKYAYFAKIQFEPVGQVTDMNKADDVANEFMGYVLPEALKTLPTPQDLERLESVVSGAENNNKQ